MNRSRSSSPPQFWLSPEQATEHRLTRLEVGQEDHSSQIEDHAEKHSAQDVWNKGFSVALLGLSAGLAHAKADGLAEFLAHFLKALKP